MLISATIVSLFTPIVLLFLNNEEHYKDNENNRGYIVFLLFCIVLIDSDVLTKFQVIINRSTILRRFENLPASQDS